MVDEKLEAAFRARLEDREPFVSQSSAPHCYASESLGCARQIGIRLLDLPIKQSVGTATLINWFVGRLLHKVVQDVMATYLPNFEPETKWDMGCVTGRADGIYTNEAGERVIVEIKTMSSSGFNRALTRMAPAEEHVMQAMLSAVAKDAQQVHLVYICKNSYGDSSSLLEFRLGVDEGTTEVELARMEWIVGLVRDGIIPDRYYQGKVIADPAKQKWPCSYCNAKDVCLSIGPGEHPVAVLGFPGKTEG